MSLPLEDNDDNALRAVPPASVIIPAHNESGVIGRCLDSLLRQGPLDAVQVVVVANGCSDDTAERARAYSVDVPGLTVIDRGQAGKVGALNAGDTVATRYPRIYLDADIELQDGALGPLVDALTTSEARVAAPRVDFRTESSSRSVQAYYDVFRVLPYASSDLVGLGVYGLSESGRSRFGRFPEVIADDLYVQRHFAPEERVITDLAFHVFAPLDLRSLLDVRTRVARGNTELATLEGSGPAEALAATTGPTSTALVRMLIRNPTIAPSVAVYCTVTLLARQRARRPSSAAWLRDTSTRGPGPTAEVGGGAGPSSRPRVVVDGIAIDALTETEAVERVIEDIARGDGGLIVTPNTDILRQLRRGHDDTVATASLVVADGMPIIWASRLQGTPLPERVTGADLVWSLSRAASRRRLKVFLLGGAPGVAQRAGETLAEANPGLNVVGSYSPELGFDASEESVDAVVARVREAGPHLVFIALGFPRQEKLALRLREDMPTAWFLGCGGALDMAAGDTVRAHPRLQRWGGEWLHRLFLQPRRLARRYLVDDLPYALGMLMRASARRARPGTAPADPPAPHATGATGAVTAATGPRFSVG